MGAVDPGAVKWTSPFLRGNWAPVSEEQHEPVLCQVTHGGVPPSVSGAFLRIGPNPPPPRPGGAGLDERHYHFFQGDGMVHCVELRDGGATYRRRFVRTPHYLTGQDEAADGERGGLANTAMVFQAGRLLCLEEGSKPYEMELPSLRTTGRFTFDGRLRHNFTAHPKVCPSTGELVFFGYGPHSVEGSDAFVHYSVAAPDGTLKSTVPVHFRKPFMAHDMAITRHYSLLLDFPLWSMTAPTKVEDRSRFGVLPRHALSEAEVRWFDAPGQYGYHVANAWERDERVIDLVMVSSLNFSFRRSNLDLRLHHFALDVRLHETVEDDILCDIPCDFPIVDPKRVGRKTRFTWASRLCRGVQEPLPVDGILRYDFQTRTTTELTFPGGRRGGECQFVPRSGEEGDGHLLVLTFSPGGSSELLLFDAMTMSPAPVAVVSIPMRVPYGFHALWVEADAYVRRSKL